MRWSTFTNYAAIDSVVWNDAFTQIGADSAVCQDSDTANSDQRIVNGVSTISGIGGTIETAFLKFAGVQGFKRVWWVYLIGDTNGGYHSPQIFLTKNYEAAPFESYSTPFQTIGPSLFMNGPLPPDVTWQFRHPPSIGKVESLKVKVVFAPEIGQAPWNLQNLTLELGVTGRGYRDLPASKTL